MRFLLTAMIFICFPAPELLAWGNPTHFMIGEELRSLESLPDACLTDRFVISNNVPDMFAFNGPGFAHSDYRFTEILLELAGDDVDKQAFAYGCFAHIAADAIVHTEYLPVVDLNHVIKELSMSAILYYDNPQLREAGSRVEVGYYPQMIREASEIYVERYNQGRVIDDEEMQKNARLLMYGIIGQRFVMRNVLFLSWASRSVPRSEWMDFYNRSVDSAYSAIINARHKKSDADYHTHTHSNSDALSLALLGDRLCALMGVSLDEYNRGDYVSFSVHLPESSDRDDLLLREILSSSDLDESLQWMSGFFDKVDPMRSELAAPGISLLPSHPNPFNALTKVTIECKIIVDRIDVSVINLAGQHVARLFSGSFSIGVHTFDWNGSDDSGREVSSGVYFVTVRTDNITLNQKLLLVK